MYGLSLSQSDQRILCVFQSVYNNTTDEIKYKRGILQDDALSVILFILSVNPSSFLLNRAERFEITEKKSLNHIVFVDDLSCMLDLTN